MKNTNSTPQPDLQAIFQPRYDHEQKRRKLTTYYKSFSKNLLQAVFSTADLTQQDAERIVTIFGANLDSYHGPESKSTFRSGFRKWATEWCVRYALLTATVTPLLPALTRLAESTPGLIGDDYRLVANRLLDNLHGYSGHVYDTDALAEWTADWVTREVQATVALGNWITEHQGIVYHGLLEILDDCKDLISDGTIDELASEVWMFVAANAQSFTEGPVPIHLRLRARAVFVAMGWRTQRIREGIKYRTNYEILETEPDRDENLLQPPARPTTCLVQY